MYVVSTLHDRAVDFKTIGTLLGVKVGGQSRKSEKEEKSRFVP
jgi:hypothetical protein